MAGFLLLFLSVRLLYGSSADEADSGHGEWRGVKESEDRRIRINQNIVELESLDAALPLFPDMQEGSQSDIASTTPFSRLVMGVVYGDPSVANNLERRYDHFKGTLLRPLLRQFFNLLREDTPFIFQNSIAISNSPSAEGDPVMSIRVVNSYGNGGNGSAFFETLRDEIMDNDEDLRTSRLSSRPLERVFTETQASCPDVLTSFSWLFLYPVNYHVEWMRSDVKVDVGAIFHHAKEAFNENTLWNTHNQIVGMEVLYSHASGMMRLLEVLIQVMLAAILHKPHCFDDESRMALCKSLAGPINAVREKWRRLEYHTAWRGLFHHSPAYLLKNHVQEALDLCVNIVGSVRDLQLAMNALAARVEVTHNEKGQHSNGHVDGHYFPTWRPAEDSGGFIDFLYLYKAHFGEWHVDKGLLRGTVKLFVNRQSRSKK